MSITEMTVLNPEFSPCFNRTGAQVTVTVETPGLDQLSGTVRQATNYDGPMELLTAYIVEGVFTYRDSAGAALWTDIQSVQLDTVASSPAMSMLIASSWEGITINPDGFEIAPPGFITLEVNTNLLRVRGQEGFTLTEEVLHSATVVRGSRIVDQPARCAAWAAIAPTLGAGTNGQVRVHGLWRGVFTQPRPKPTIFST